MYYIFRQFSIELLPAASEQSLSGSMSDRAKEESTGAGGTAELRYSSTVGDKIITRVVLLHSQ